MLFLESTGCRRGGIANLKLNDLNLDQPDNLARQAVVKEKGGKSRIVFLSNEAVSALQDWFEERDSKSEFVFTNLAHEPDRKLSPSGVSQIIRRYKEQCGIPRKVSPHQWRHRHGRKLTQAGMPLGVVSQILGHSSTKVTNDYYGIFAVNELQQMLDQYYSPPNIEHN